MVLKKGNRSLEFYSLFRKEKGWKFLGYKIDRKNILFEVLFFFVD